MCFFFKPALLLVVSDSALLVRVATKRRPPTKQGKNAQHERISSQSTSQTITQHRDREQLNSSTQNKDSTQHTPQQRRKNHQHTNQINRPAAPPTRSVNFRPINDDDCCGCALGFALAAFADVSSSSSLKLGGRHD